MWRRDGKERDCVVLVNRDYLSIFEEDKYQQTMQSINFSIIEDNYSFKCKKNERLHLVRCKISNGLEHILEFDEEGKLIHEVDEKGNLTKNKYNSRGYLVYIASPIDNIYLKYDEKGNCISEERDEYDEYFEYNELGNRVGKKYESTLGGYEEIYEYDNFDNIIYKYRIMHNHNIQTWYEYDAENRLIHQKRLASLSKPLKYDKWYEYDQDGNIIHTKDSEGREERFEYIIREMLPMNRIVFRVEDTSYYVNTPSNETLLKVIYKHSNGNSFVFEFDEKGKPKVDDITDEEMFKSYLENRFKQNDSLQYKYNDDGNLMRIWNKSINEETFFDYDKNHNLIAHKTSSNKALYEYNAQNNLVYMESSALQIIDREEQWYRDYEKCSECDESGNVVHTIDYYSEEEWFEYETRKK